MNVLTRQMGWIDVPDWCRGTDEESVRLEACLSLGPSEERNFLRQPRDLRRVLAYACVDGPRETFRKIRSRKIEEAVRGSRELVIGAGHRISDDAPVLVIGTRHPRWAPQAPFATDLIFPVPGYDNPAAALGAFFLLAGSEREDIKTLRAWLAPLLGYDPACGTKPCLPSGLSEESLCRALARSKAEDENPPSGCLLAAMAYDPARSRRRSTANAERASFALMGAGNYARTQASYHLLHGGLRCQWVVDRDPVCAEVTRAALDANKAATEPSGALADPKASLLVITTFHDTHARLAVEGLNAGKTVFVEKPPAISRDQLFDLFSACKQAPSRWRVGYNRRYARFTHAAKAALDHEDGPVTLTCVVREATIPRGHWYYWPSQGTRISGNICHWIDLAFLLCGKKDPVRISLLAPVIEGRRDEETCVVIEFSDGSQATVVGTGRGDGTLGIEEHIEARRGASTFTISDYRAAVWKRGGRVVKSWRGMRDRGHRAMFRSCARWVQSQPSQEPLDYTLQDLWVPTLITIMASEMAIAGETVRTIAPVELVLP